MTRICKNCKKRKDLNLFNKNKPSKLGRLSACRKCTNSAYNTGFNKFIYNIKNRFDGLAIAVYERDNYRCVSCHLSEKDHIQKWARRLTIDHIDGNGRYSIVKNNSIKNLQTLCLSCHGKKDRQVAWDLIKAEKVLK